MSGTPFEGLRPPGPPAALRDRVLAACSRAITAPPEADETWVDRLWTSRTARAAWLATVLLLAAANLLLVGAGTRPVRQAGWRPAVARPAAGEEALHGWPARLGARSPARATWSEPWPAGARPPAELE